MKDMNGHKFRISSGVLITAALILLAAGALVFLWHSGILTGENSTEDGSDETADALYGLEENPETGVIYYEGRDLSPKDLLASLRETDSVVWNFRAVDAWETSAYTVERITASRLGVKYRIESDSRLIICDGATVYRREGMLEMTLDASLTDFYAEAGLTPLTAIQNTPDEQVSGLSCDDPKNIKYIRMTVQDGDFRTEYKISVETGIPVEERSYFGNAVYRMVMTDSISVFAAQQLPDDYFDIPDFESR